MTCVNWLLLLMMIAGWACAFVIAAQADKLEEENKYIRESLQTEHNRAEYFRKKAEHKEVFDFEKVNSEKEK